MVIRAPKFAEVPQMIDVLRWGYERSIYKGRATFDDREANRVLVACIQRDGGKGEAGTFVRVSDKGGKIEGLIVGVLQRAYSLGVELSAVDLFWVCTPKAGARDSLALAKAFLDWGRAHPKVADIQCGATAVMGDPERAGKILERMGMRRFGLVYRMEVMT